MSKDQTKFLADALAGILKVDKKRWTPKNWDKRASEWDKTIQLAQRALNNYELSKIRKKFGVKRLKGKILIPEKEKAMK